MREKEKNVELLEIKLNLICQFYIYILTELQLASQLEGSQSSPMEITTVQHCHTGVFYLPDHQYMCQHNPARS